MGDRPGSAEGIFAVGDQQGAPIVHLTTVHSRNDIRIALKEAAALDRAAPGRTLLMVADGQGAGSSDGLRIVDLGAPGPGRLRRFASGNWRAFRAIHRLRPASLHFHDPELLPLGLLLRVLGHTVIYDVHEDVPRQILTKYWLPPPIRRPVAWAVEGLEWLAGRALSAIVTATPAIARRFPPARTVVVQNFPLEGEFAKGSEQPLGQRPPHFIYAGGIAAIRGAAEMSAAINLVATPGARLKLVGKFQQPALEQTLLSSPGWSRIDFAGWASRSEMSRLFGEVRGGLVVFHPVPNHVDAQPNKLFEYMAAGLPVIASRFPLWEEIIDASGCGLLVDPLNPQEIAAAMDWLLAHPEESEAMGRRGRQAVEDRYNWKREAESLLGLYQSLKILV